MKILGGKPYYIRGTLANDFNLSDCNYEKVQNDINVLSFYSKFRDPVAADQTGKTMKSFQLPFTIL